MILGLEGETVTDARASIGYLHTGIEKNMEYRTWTQGSTFITRCDYLMSLFNETAYCLAVERLLGIEDQLPERAKLIRVLLLELNRISCHLGGIGPTVWVRRPGTSPTSWVSPWKRSSTISSW